MMFSEYDGGTCFEESLASAERRHTELIRLVNEQAAVRRTAMLVAHGLPPDKVFQEVAGAVGSMHAADYSVISRYEPDLTMSVVAFWAAPEAGDVRIPSDLHWKADDSGAAEVLRTNRPVRRVTSQIGGDVGEWSRSVGIEHVIACPIKVEEEVWGELAVLYRAPRPPPDGTEHHVANFVQLLGCTIAQAESRAELIASRARLVGVFDAARRALERDLHDGVQQRLISLGLQLREAEDCLTPDQRVLGGHLRRIDEDLREIRRQVHEISHGLRPAVLSRGGLDSALLSMTRRFTIPVDFDVDFAEPLDESSEIAIYYLVSESLTNIAKHANADRAAVRAGRDDDRAWIEISDDGGGGADPRDGSGIIGLQDRVEALGGTFRIISPQGEGTVIQATVPA
ncbi:GAF domain-containing sensor histidine kinase [Actinomadura sp. DC4]|uniref:GAF domain-containing sensor histidine kinase n=1 Tax=Actinomadura sp. DC4 TaxID=3055069 RepID=UPI0025B27713|nr:GAF domain-containing sensor histidine kinase [Actinomadura sp. DC4]MDN3357270.1 GAF domain-containing sensor histidine kinase [Actinomadura sp. DC4]